MYSDLNNARAQIIALADLLDRPPGRLEGETLRGLSLLAWHIADDIGVVLKDLEP
jgi:hypothetical protein